MPQSRTPIRAMREVIRALRRVITRSASPLLLLLSCGLLSQAASVLTHEAIVDALWDVKMKPELLDKYPQATADELKRAHGFAYGGAILQDLGYYPRGSAHFSNLTHYVRTGDFVVALLREANSLDELAFAFGALSHYDSDILIHRYATNVGEPELYPRIRAKFGNYVNYEQAPPEHLKTEFGFDVLEVAHGNFAPEAYHDFIGFYIAQGSLERAFFDCYNLSLPEVFPDFERSINSYRHDISTLIPKATRIAWAQRQSDIQKNSPGITRDRFVYIMRRSSYEHDWGKQYDRPSTGERFLAFLLRLLPPVGALNDLRLRVPTPEVEKLFMTNFDRSVDRLQHDLADYRNPQWHLDDLNFDLGTPAPPGEYHLEDESYRFWLHSLAKRNFDDVRQDAKDTITAYVGPMLSDDSNGKGARRARMELAQLKAHTAAPATITAAATSSRATGR